MEPRLIQRMTRLSLVLHEIFIQTFLSRLEKDPVSLRGLFFSAFNILPTVFWEFNIKIECSIKKTGRWIMKRLFHPFNK
jgi:hypothetical protein|tara:strand:- start:697 stop:933 length:237 start_codon:yes stop_codon:yes gene_type:complete